MWAFFARENVSTGACSQLDVIICSDIQRRVKRTVNSELPWITKKKKKKLYMTADQVFQNWFSPVTKIYQQCHLSAYNPTDNRDLTLSVYKNLFKMHVIIPPGLPFLFDKIREQV